MTQPELLERIREVVAERLKVDPDTITTASDMASLGADSLDVVVMAREFEDIVGAELTTADIKRIRTVGDVIEALLARRQVAGAPVAGTQP